MDLLSKTGLTYFWGKLKTILNGKADLDGAAFTGAVTTTPSGNSTAQVRNITISSSDPSGGNNGDIWIVI